MVFPAIRLVHMSEISSRIALLAVRFVLKSHLVSANYIRVLASANQSYLIIGLKQPINFKKNVIRQMSKNKKFTYVMITLDCLSNLLHIKTENMDSYSKLSKNCK